MEIGPSVIAVSVNKMTLTVSGVSANDGTTGFAFIAGTLTNSSVCLHDDTREHIFLQQKVYVQMCLHVVFFYLILMFQH